MSLNVTNSLNALSKHDDPVAAGSEAMRAERHDRRETKSAPQAGGLRSGESIQGQVTPGVTGASP
jgi:hypothetical protein